MDTPGTKHIIAPTVIYPSYHLCFLCSRKYRNLLANSQLLFVKSDYSGNLHLLCWFNLLQNNGSVRKHVDTLLDCTLVRLTAHSTWLMTLQQHLSCQIWLLHFVLVAILYSCLLLLKYNMSWSQLVLALTNSSLKSCVLLSHSPRESILFNNVLTCV